MVSSVSNTPKTAKTSIFYMNDVHGQSLKMERLYKASDDFDSFVPSEKTNKLKFASGDIMLGRGIKENIVASNFLDLCKIMASAIGNHEVDGKSPDNLIQATVDKKYKLLASNIHPGADNPISKIVQKSYIQEQDGVKYGVIGLTPVDLFQNIKFPESYKSLNLDSFEETVKDVQAEVDKFQKQGVDKVIVLSHMGHSNGQKLAQQTSGVDVILGGHTHELIKDIKEGYNLIYSKNGEPVILTQAGRDGNNFGVLNLDFNEKGVITKAQNNIGNTNDFGRSFVAKYLFERILGKPEIIGNIDKVAPPVKNIYAEENPQADFTLDALRSQLGTDVAIIHSANMRGVIEKGVLDTRVLTSAIAPFNNKTVVVKISEKDLVNSIKKLGKRTFSDVNTRPGIMQVSGLTYKMSKKDGELLEMNMLDKSGQILPVDVKNPNSNKLYTLASDDYGISGENALNLPNLLTDGSVIQKFDTDKDKFVADFIKKQTAPIEIKADGRIKIVD